MDESVPTVSSAAMSIIFYSFGMMKIKIKGKINTKYFPLIFFCCFHMEPLFISRAEQTSDACALSQTYIQNFMIEFKTSSGSNNDKHNKHLKGTLDEALQAVLEFND